MIEEEIKFQHVFFDPWEVLKRSISISPQIHILPFSGKAAQFFVWWFVLFIGVGIEQRGSDMPSKHSITELPDPASYPSLECCATVALLLWGKKDTDTFNENPHTIFMPELYLLLKKEKKRNRWAWREGSEVKSTGCSSRGPEFNSQQPHGVSQPSVMGSDVLIWFAGIYVVRALYTQ